MLTMLRVLAAAATGCLLLCLGFASRTEGAVIITEIMYNPPQGSDYEFVEVFNSGAQTVSLAGWSFTQGITYSFPSGASIPSGAYFVVCKSKAALSAAYPAIPASLLFGDYTGTLSNNGENLTLVDQAQAVQQTLSFGSDPPWDFLADGFGASLERICYTADPSLPENWRAGSVPASPESFGGSPGSGSTAQICPPVFPAKPRLYISEIMYHPVLEQNIEDLHEFIEIHSEEASPVSIDGWRVAGAVDFTFPSGAVIAAKGYAVIAKDKTKLAAISSYGLTAGGIFGNYTRTLDNGGEKVALIDSTGQGIDSVTYHDGFPWPVGADALGANENWLPASILPLENHRYRGISLERVSFDYPSSEISNWAPSPLDGATPGKPNASARAVPLPVAVDIDASPAAGTDPLIRSGDQVRIQARFSPPGLVSAVDVQYFVDDISVSNEPLTNISLLDNGAGGDLISGDGIFSALLPKNPDNSIVRYRIRADRGAGVEVISPRPSDPYAWHAYFVSPVINTQTRVYQLFITPQNWGTLWNNITSGRVNGCAIRDSWDAQLPAVFVYNGKVIDVRVRYQGSRYNRTNGPALASWPFPGPTAGPNPPRALSWRIALPAYASIDSSHVVELNKLTQGCPGYDAGVGFRLYEMADIPAPQTRFARLHINGGYYHYMLQIEHNDEDLIKRYNSYEAQKYPDRPKEGFVGHMFKSVGCNCDEGPFGWGDERALPAACGWTKLQRYQYTYDRQTWSWADYNGVMNLIEGLNAARASLPDTSALRDYFEQNFDLDILLNYIAITNWAVPFDDMFQNHFLYQRLSDGKWIVTPWDLDLNFGGWKGASASLYMGEEGDPDNRSAWWNYWKDGFLKAYRPEFEDRLLLLTNTLLSPASVNPLVDAITAEANPAEAAQAPAGVACSFSGAASSFKGFASQRKSVINSKLSAVIVNAGADQTVLAGSTVQFDARASRPDPGPNVIYAWDNGMTGDFPTFAYPAAGAYTVVLTMTVNGVPYSDSVTITVQPKPDKAFQETNGAVVMEAENFTYNDDHGASDDWWEPSSVFAGYSGSGYMLANFTTYTKVQSNYASTSPELRYAILFEDTGAYRVWIRSRSTDANADSCHVNLDSIGRDDSFGQRLTVDSSGAFQWWNMTVGQGAQVINVPTTGLHFLSIWIRESGQIIDKIIMTKDASFTPAGTGPAESSQTKLSSNAAFVRGDANDDGRVDISDALSILFFLFRGSSSLTCEDHGDFDDNGSVEITDAISLLTFLFHQGPPPKPPFPNPGLDPTADAFPCGN